MSINQHVSYQKFTPHFSEEDDAWLNECELKMLEHLVHEQAQRCWEHACQYFKNLPMPSVWCDLRGKSAGQAHFSRDGLRFNPVLLKQNPRIFLNQVVPHEMAHWVVHYGISKRLAPHGREWKFIMTELYGIPAEVTHRFDVSQSSPSPYLYRCECLTDDNQPLIHHFTTRRHNLVGKGRRYLCKRCRAELMYVGKR